MYRQHSVLGGVIVARQKAEVFMHSLWICGVMIYFMARGERLTKKQAFGNQDNPVYAVWPIGRMWGVAVHNGSRWTSLSNIPAKNERDAYDYVMEDFYKNSGDTTFINISYFCLANFSSHDSKINIVKV